MSTEMKAEHSKVPWRVGVEYPATVFAGYGGSATLVCQCDPHDKFNPISDANAALIVRCVNVHDALVDALTRALPFVEDAADNAEAHGFKPGAAAAMIKHVRAALALATKE